MYKILYYHYDLIKAYTDFMYSQKYWYLEKFDVTTKLSKDEIIQYAIAVNDCVVCFMETNERRSYPCS